jgi:phosphatidylglycerol lysyltransferase
LTGPLPGITARYRWATALPALAALVVFGIALFALHRLTGEFHLRDILDTISAVPLLAVVAAAAFTAASYAVLTLFDVLALRHVARPLPYLQAAVTSFIAHAVGHNVGVVAFSGGAIRYRMYSLAGLGSSEIAQVVAFCALTFQLGAGLLLGISLIGEAGYASSVLHASAWLARTAGWAILATIAAYLVLTAVRGKPLAIGSWRIALPSWRATAGQLVIGVADLVAACAALYVLLPADAGVSFTVFLGLYMVAMVAGAISAVPGGLGVFESLLLLLVPGVKPEAMLGALLLYRLVYYVVPFLLAVIGMTAHEMRRQQAHVRRAWLWSRRLLNLVVPQAMSALVFLAGLILLVSGATPSTGDRIAALEGFLPLSIVEFSHLGGSVIGVALLILARGLYYRLDAAWHLTLWMLGAGMAASLLKGLDYEEALVLAVILLPLLVSRREFYRRAALFAEPLTPRWLAAVAMAVAASVWVGFLAHREVPYRNELWWQFAFDASAPRMLRASLVAAVLLGTVIVLRLLQPRRPVGLPPSAMEIERAREIVRSGETAGGNLALLGDKSLLFSESGRTFIMYGTSGRSRICLGDPVGPANEHGELIWRFRELCDREGGWCVFYEVTPDELPLYVDAGLSLSKLGEEARVPLAAFSLEGSERAALRQANNRAEREGAGFRVVPASGVEALLPSLREVSDDWLAAKSTAEKGFSIGFFQESYLCQCPCAIVEKAGKVVAFANLWTASNRSELSVDLMRYRHDAPKGVMDYLFVQIMLWGKQEGYQWFSLGMAPLAGLESHRLAPAWHKLGRLVYRYGENFYNFDGLRHYKQKFQPEWRPRYLASPPGAALPRVLLDVTALISGGLAGVVGRGAQARELKRAQG